MDANLRNRKTLRPRQKKYLKIKDVKIAETKSIKAKAKAIESTVVESTKAKSTAAELAAAETRGERCGHGRRHTDRDRVVVEGAHGVGYGLERVGRDRHQRLDQRVRDDAAGRARKVVCRSHQWATTTNSSHGTGTKKASAKLAFKEAKSTAAERSEVVTAVYVIAKVRAEGSVILDNGSVELEQGLVVQVRIDTGEGHHVGGAADEDGA